ncbi:uncharacterized protein RCC_08059 [Ramularia collo-cygni]|uniref:Mediator of RNA polymerase II transcription subunit 1 n=1 Tax=Ramularia collo-cygni TaxID=112498 RepID=A0A2D3V9R8_9PEZI|nr:uncharacterized protein RCC_08059 [Ramularia collo-cygni]CZT22190.1 uncharacterized protein RCC_08059 [Ramularia collo-cygni]
MATPQSAPPPPLHPSSAGKKNNHQNAPANATVHTPAGPASAPRSVPSPAAIRGKTPAGNSATAASAANMKLGGTPMGFSLSSLGMSPAAFTPGMAMGGLPVAGGGFTPGGSSSSTMMMTMMMPSMSDLGISSTGKRGGGVDGDYERRRRMKGVLRKIGRGGKRGGGVCEEGICRVSRRVGLANDVDAEGEEARREAEGERPISIAGRDVLIDVEMRGNAARGVVVAGMGGVGEEEMGRAGKVLERLLVRDGGGDLEGFGRELGRIAGLDRLGESGVSAFEALSGVGACLERLYAKECEREGPRDVLRKRSGRPWMHARGRIGLGLDYWTTAPPKDDNAMHLDSHPQQEEEEEDSADFLTLHLTAESCPAGMYPPIRISSDWLPSDLSSISKNDAPNLQHDEIPWQDPPPTYTKPSPDQPDTSTTTTNTKLPDLRFLAKLDPPLIVPYQTASQILGELGGGGDGVHGMMFREWHLMIAGEAQTNNNASGGSGAGDNNQDAIFRANGLSGSSIVLGRDGREFKHIYDVQVSKAEWGYRIEELPFAHPRQVVGILPVLRQWGVFGRLVGGVLGKSSISDVEKKKDGDAEKKDGDGVGDTLHDLLLSPSLREDDIDPLAISRKEGEMEEVRFQVEISTTPVPTLSLSFPLTSSSSEKKREETEEKVKMGKVLVRIGRNGEVECLAVQGLGDGDGDGVEMEEVKGRISRALERCCCYGGEVGVWGEWLRMGGMEGDGRGGDGGD